MKDSVEEKMLKIQDRKVDRLLIILIPEFRRQLVRNE